VVSQPLAGPIFLSYSRSVATSTSAMACQPLYVFFPHHSSDLRIRAALVHFAHAQPNFAEAVAATVRGLASPVSVWTAVYHPELDDGVMPTTWICTGADGRLILLLDNRRDVRPEIAAGLRHLAQALPTRKLELAGPAPMRPHCFYDIAVAADLAIETDGQVCYLAL
jgi:hypothetical protein